MPDTPDKTEYAKTRQKAAGSSPVLAGDAKNAPELVYRTQNTAQDFSCVQRLSYRASVSSGRFSNISQPARNAASGNMIA